MPSTQVLSSVGPSDPVVISTQYNGTTPMAPGIFCVASDGADLTYNVEVSPDAVEPRSWAPLDDATGLTASTARELGFVVRAVRANVTNLHSGTLAFTALQ